MEKKGLCMTCIKFKECIFPKKFPVWECDEFRDGKSRARCSHKR